MTTQNQIPEGYRQDAQGRLIPIDAIKPIDMERDVLVAKLVDDAKKCARILHDYKVRAFADIAAFVELSAEQYGAKVGGAKGNVTLMSFDGKYKVLRAADEFITFDERLQAAKALIDECLRDWTKSTGPEIRALIDRAFEVGKQGQINTGRILALRRVAIDDPRWQDAMQAISESVQVVGSKNYIRVYERVGDSDRYTPIPLDVAGA